MKNKKKKVTVEELLQQEKEVAQETGGKPNQSDDTFADATGKTSHEEADERMNRNGDDAEEGNVNATTDDPSDKKDASVDASKNEEIAVRYLRLQADFQNYKRRTEEEQKNTIRYANERLILQLLDVVDNFERALATEKEHDNFFLGMEMIHSQLREILEKNGVEAIVADGEAFDPNLHHAVLTEESAEVDEGHVIETLQTGYKLNGKLIRPAMVKVAK